MVLKNAAQCYLGADLVKKIYLGSKLVYTYMTPAPPVVSEESMLGSNSAETYTEGSTSWGQLTLSAGCTTSKDGIEIQNSQTYVSASTSGLSYPMTFEFKGRIDDACYRPQGSNPGMLFGFGASANSWFNCVTCYATSDQGITIDSVLTRGKIKTGVKPKYAHIIVVINSSAALTLYINGTNNAWTASADSATRANKTYIYNGEGSGRFIGAINTMRWWNSALSMTEIEELFASDDDNYVL